MILISMKMSIGNLKKFQNICVLFFERLEFFDGKLSNRSHALVSISSRSAHVCVPSQPPKKSSLVPAPRAALSRRRRGSSLSQRCRRRR